MTNEQKRRWIDLVHGYGFDRGLGWGYWVGFAVGGAFGVVIGLLLGASR